MHIEWNPRTYSSHVASAKLVSAHDRSDNPKGREKWFVCSDQCQDTFAATVENNISEEDIDPDVPGVQTLWFIRRTIFSPENRNWVSKELSKAFLKKDWRVRFGSSTWDSESEKESFDKLMERIAGFAVRLKARILEKARRFEEAAQTYEDLGMYDEAGRLRSRGEQLTVKTTEVSVDLNRLLQQVIDSGLVVVYRCPHCSGNIKIGKDTTADNLRFCGYCGSRIETIDLKGIIKSALS